MLCMPKSDKKSDDYQGDYTTNQSFLGRDMHSENKYYIMVDDLYINIKIQFK